MLFTVQVVGQAVDVNDPLLLVVHPAVDSHAGGVESEACVMLVKGLLVFVAAVRPDRQGGSVAEGESLQAPADVVEFVSLAALHVFILRSFWYCIYHSERQIFNPSKMYFFPIRKPETKVKRPRQVSVSTAHSGILYADFTP